MNLEGKKIHDVFKAPHPLGDNTMPKLYMMSKILFSDLKQ